MSDDLRVEYGVRADLGSYFAVTRDKANQAPPGKRTWRRTVSVDLGQGDEVGVVGTWSPPATFDGVAVGDLLRVQRAIHARVEAGEAPRFSDQSSDWVGHIVAAELDLAVLSDMRRIKKMIDGWLKTGALVKGTTMGPIRKPVPTVEVGEWATE